MQRSIVPQSTPPKTRRIVGGTLLVVGIAAIFWLLLRVHDLLILLFLAIVLSTAMKPAVNGLYRRNVPRPLGIAIVYAVLFLAVAALAALLLPPSLEQTARIVSELPSAYVALRSTLLSMDNLLVARVVLALPTELSFGGESPDAATALANLANGLRLGGRFTFLSLATFVLAYYWTLENERLERAALLLLPMERRAAARTVLDEIEDRLARFVAGQAILMLVVGILSFVAYLVIGLPYAFLLATVAGLMEAVPIVGPFLGIIPAALVGFSLEPAKAFWVVVAGLIIQQLENNLLVPRVMNRAVGVNPLLTILALVAFGSLFGIPGALIAVPAAAIGQFLFSRFVLDRGDMPESNLIGRDRWSVLRYQAHETVEDIRRQAKNHGTQLPDTEETIEDALESIALDLQRILAQHASAGDQEAGGNL